MTGRHRAAPQRRTLRTGPLLVLIAAATAAAITALVLLTPDLTLPGTTAAAAGAPVDLNGNRVELDPGETPANPADVISNDTGARLTVPSVGLDVPLGAINARDGEITPPGFTRAFTIANMGAAPSNATDGTVYVVTHSLRGGGRAPGNYLFDTKTSRSRIDAGDEIHLGDHTYSVTRARTVAKPDLADDRELWTNTPRRLVLITCLQNPRGTASTENFIIEAELEDPPA